MPEYIWREEVISGVVTNNKAFESVISGTIPKYALVDSLIFLVLPFFTYSNGKGMLRFVRADNPHQG